MSDEIEYRLDEIVPSIEEAVLAKCIVLTSQEGRIIDSRSGTPEERNRLINKMVSGNDCKRKTLKDIRDAAFEREIAMVFLSKCNALDLQETHAFKTLNEKFNNGTQLTAEENSFRAQLIMKYLASRDCENTTMPSIRSASFKREDADLKKMELWDKAKEPLPTADKTLGIQKNNSASPAATGPIEDAKVAYNRGDYVTTLQIIRPLANQGNAEAQLFLGIMYARGDGLSKDENESAKWIRKSADQNYALAQRHLGRLYERGDAVLKDETEAIKWYRKAAEQGDAEAQYNLGLMYQQGSGVQQDDSEAIKWYRKAAEKGNAYAQMSLGADYWSGNHGVSQNLVQAYKWYELSIQALPVDMPGRAGVVEIRDQLAAEMTPEQIAEAQKLSSEPTAKTMGAPDIEDAAAAATPKENASAVVGQDAAAAAATAAAPVNAPVSWDKMMKYEYVVFSGTDGKFTMNFIHSSGKVQSEKHALKVCILCLRCLPYREYSRVKRSEQIEIYEKFSLEEYFTKYPKDHIMTKPTHTDKEAPLNQYSTNFKDKSQQVRSENNWTCGQCKVDLSEPKHRKYLQTHHRNGAKFDDSRGNLGALCIRCHAEEYGHGHMKATPDYKYFLVLWPTLQSPLPRNEPPPNNEYVASRIQDVLSALKTHSEPDKDSFEKARRMAVMNNIEVEDFRSKNGAFWVNYDQKSGDLAIALLNLGFNYRPGRGWWKE